MLGRESGYDPDDLEVAKPPTHRRSLLTSRYRVPVNFPKCSVKYISLGLLVLQNSALVVTMHYSRVVPVVGHRRYFPSTAIFLVEVVKLVICSAVVLQELARSYSPISSIALVDKFFKSVFSPDSWKLAIPAALWTLQNSVIYVGISNLDPATFQVTYQLKILTTVLFSILLLGKTISHKQWLALVLLTAGVAIVQMSGLHISMAALLNNIQEMLSTTFILRTSPITNDPLRGSYTLELTPTNPAMNASLGIIAVVGASFISGITGVYFEKVLKESSTSATMWTRNIQLSFFSLFPALIFGVIGQDGHEIMREGFFVGYTGIVWTMIALQAVGGLIVAVCITYADNIAKNFAASISIVVSCIANALIFDVPLTANFAFGTAIVLSAVYLYQRFKPQPKAADMLGWTADRIKS